MLSNAVFISIAISAVMSQGLKILFHCIHDKRLPSIFDFIVTGGMPSTHSALVSSLLAILFLTEGFSPLTAISLVLFIIVITDSIGVRRTAGEEAIALNKIISLEKLKISQLKYALGHKPIEVFMGCIIGFFISILIFLL